MFIFLSKVSADKQWCPVLYVWSERPQRIRVNCSTASACAGWWFSTPPITTWQPGSSPGYWHSHNTY